jgi:preprotein translocase subunit SecD
VLINERIREERARKSGGHSGGRGGYTEAAAIFDGNITNTSQWC